MPSPFLALRCPLRLAMALVVMAPLCSSASAQSSTDPSALPDLAPREIEIRGELEISFPSLRRQPLIGFNPPPRIPEIDPARAPYTETYRTSSADLPESPLQRPTPPGGGLFNAPPPGQALLQATFGRFTSRQVRGHAATSIGSTGSLYGQVTYEGTGGHEPFGDTTTTASAFDAVAGRVGLLTRQDAWSAGAEVEGAYDTYGLFGAVIGASPLDVLPTPDRTVRQLGGQAWLRTAPTGTVDAEVRLRLEDTEVTTDVFARDDARFARTERRVEATRSAATELAIGVAEIDLRGGLASLDPSNAFARDLDHLDAGALLRFPYQQFDAVAGLRFLTYGVSPALTGTEEVRRGYLAPTLRVAFYPADGLEVYLRQAPSITPNGLSALYRTAPYLVDEPAQRPTVRLVDAEAGIHWFAGALQLSTAAGVEMSPNYRVFEHQPVSLLNAYEEGISRVSYAEARILRIQGQVAYVTRTGVEVSLTAVGQHGRLPDGDADGATVVPYLPPLAGEVRLSYGPAASRLRLQAVGTLASARWRDRQEAERVDAFMDLDLEGQIRITDFVSVVARVGSVANDGARWSGYPRAPTVVQGGLRMAW